MNLKLDYNYVLEGFVGDEGLDTGDISLYSSLIATAIENMKKKKKEGKMDFRKIPFEQNDVVKEINDYCEEVKSKGKIDTFVVLGIGGSAL